jgi:hypothetical protein
MRRRHPSSPELPSRIPVDHRPPAFCVAWTSSAGRQGRRHPPATASTTSAATELEAAGNGRARDRRRPPCQLSLGGRPRVDAAAPELEAMVSTTAGKTAVRLARSSHGEHGLTVLERYTHLNTPLVILGSPRYSVKLDR